MEQCLNAFSPFREELMVHGLLIILALMALLPEEFGKLCTYGLHKSAAL